MCIFCFFFFASRRRHTRCYRDWSSDVCSSDLCGWPRLPWASEPRGDVLGAGRDCAEVEISLCGRTQDRLVATNGLKLLMDGFEHRSLRSSDFPGIAA